MTKCYIKNCHNKSSFTFPKDNQLKKQWLLKIHADPESEVKSHEGLYKIHFTENDYTHTSEEAKFIKRYRLKPDAVPTLNLCVDKDIVNCSYMTNREHEQNTVDLPIEESYNSISNCAIQAPLKPENPSVCLPTDNFVETTINKPICLKILMDNSLENTILVKHRSSCLEMINSTDCRATFHVISTPFKHDKLEDNEVNQNAMSNTFCIHEEIPGALSFLYESNNKISQNSEITSEMMEENTSLIHKSSDANVISSQRHEIWNSPSIGKILTCQVKVCRAENVKRLIERYRHILLNEADRRWKKAVWDQKIKSQEKLMALHKLRKAELQHVQRRRICFICLENKINMRTHPFQESSFLCLQCLKELLPKLFRNAISNPSLYCCLCGSNRTIFCCKVQECSLACCLYCLQNFKSLGYCLQYDRCKICTMNWRNQLTELYNLLYCKRSLFKMEIFLIKPKLRVLSLGDGISTEIDSDALAVSRRNFGSRITHIDDFTDPTFLEKLDKFGPFHLIYATPPCNDLSKVNPDRKGLLDPKGSGGKALKAIELINTLKERYFCFYVFENVDTMKPSEIEHISNLLKQPYEHVDSVVISPSFRGRYYVTNLLKMVFDHVQPVFVNDILDETLQRKAVVGKLPTQTTQTNSTMLGPNQTERPIIMDGERTRIFIEEQEQLLGFPKNYTAAYYLHKKTGEYRLLSCTRRQRVLGKVLDVKTITIQLEPLCYWFRTL